MSEAESGAGRDFSVPQIVALIVGAVVVTAALTAGSVWLTVTVLRAMGVL